MLAEALGADALLMPPAWARSSFNHAPLDYSAWKRHLPLGSLLDTDAMQRTWAARGLALHNSKPPSWAACERAKDYVGNIRGLALDDVVASTRSAVAASLQRSGTAPCVHVDKGNLEFRLRQAGRWVLQHGAAASAG